MRMFLNIHTGNFTIDKNESLKLTETKVKTYRRHSKIFLERL